MDPIHLLQQRFDPPVNLRDQLLELGERIAGAGARARRVVEKNELAHADLRLWGDRARAARRSPP
jgi:hypothetical protein